MGETPHRERSSLTDDIAGTWSQITLMETRIGADNKAPGTPQSMVQKIKETKMTTGVLMVSVSTVDRMLADGEITPIRLRGKLVRFHPADVLAELREKAQASKHACTRKAPVQRSYGWLRSWRAHCVHINREDIK